MDNKTKRQDSQIEQSHSPENANERMSGRAPTPPRAAAISIDCGGGVGSGHTLNASASIYQEFRKLGYGKGARRRK